LKLTGRQMISTDMAIRIRNSYISALSDFETYGESFWQLLDQRKLEIHEILMTGSIDSIVNALSNPSENELFYGFDETYSSSFYVINEIGPEELIYSAIWLLAEALGSIPMLNPESTVPVEKPSVDELLDKISNELLVKITIPKPFPKEFGLQTKFGEITYRMVQSLYQSHLVMSNIRKFKLSGNTLLEIGGGLGRNAYNLSKFGIETTLVDLPLTQVAAASFLAQTLGEEKISLNDENMKNAIVNFKTPNKLFKTPNQKYTISLNCDSFTEMDQNVARNYLDFCLNNSNLLISINHEINTFKVTDLNNVEEFQLTRNPYWLRPGYAEELFSRKLRVKNDNGFLKLLT